jgi:DNA-directed RNA polymerase subunit alpha
MWDLKALGFTIEKESDNYGEYSFGPLESGFGLTLGTALRRTLLSSVEGVAPTGILIDGVIHEFSTIDGVVEDVEEIILNVKKLVIALENTDSAKLSFDIKGEKEFKASDLKTTSEVKILNPDLHIATVSSSKAHLSGEIYVRKGKGYKLEEEVAEMEQFSQLVIPIDAYFSPVLKVNFRVEPMRHEESVNFDKLIIGISTKPNKAPKDALTEAVEILIQYYSRLKELLVSDVDAATDEGDELSGKAIEEIGLDKRSLNALKENNINTVGELVSKREDELMRFKGFGATSLKKVKDVLEKYNLKLKE